MSTGMGVDAILRIPKAVTYLFLAMAVAVSVAGGCSKDDKDFQLTWANTHGVDVELRIDGVPVTWCGEAIADTTALPAGATRKTCETYPAGHYEYMVFQKGTNNPLTCEGRFDLDSDHKTFETKPIPGGSSYLSASGDC